MRALWMGVALIALPAISGCGAERDAAAKELASLTTEISKLRADQAMLAERLDAMERERRAEASQAAAPAYVAPTAAAGPSVSEDRPQLDVVRLAPEPVEEEDAEEGAAPTVLRSTPSGTIVEERSGSKTRTVAQLPGASAQPVAKKDKRAKRDPQRSSRPEPATTAALPTP